MGHIVVKRYSECYRFGPFVLEENERELRRGGALVPLPGKAFDLLLILVRGAGRTVTKSELMTALWADTVVEESNLTQTVFVLRKALGEDTEEAYIRTVPRHGYRLTLAVSVEGGTERPGRRPHLWLVASASVIAITAIVVGFTYLRPKQPVPLDLSAYRYRPFAYSQGHERAGAWSPDGRSIAFLQGEELQVFQEFTNRHHVQLMVQPFDGGAATQLVQQVSDWSRIAWSPDGARIYFKEMDDFSRRRPGALYSVSRAGGQPELVLKDSGFVQSFDLSPDGKALALWRAPKAADGSVRGSVWISSPPGAELHEYTPAPFAVPADLGTVMRFSPDGKLLYVSMTTLNGSGGEIWLLPFPSGTGSPRRIFRNVAWRAWPMEASWMPDSRRLVLSAAIAPMVVPALWMAGTRDESLTKLTDGSGQQEDPAVSPDGRRLLFTRVEEDADIVELPLDGSSPRKLLATSTSEHSPGWSPKGGEFAYITTRNGDYELWLRSSQGDWERPIVTAKDFPVPTWLGTPVIAPDGSRVAYVAILRDPKRPIGSVYVSPRTGGTATWVADGALPSWSPDGVSLSFVWRTPSGAPGLATLRVGSNQQPFVIPNVECVPPLPVWSPSAEWIACETAEGPVLVSPDGKKRRTLPRLNATTLAWSKDSQTLYGLHYEEGSQSLLAEDIRSGAIRRVADYGSEIAPYSRLPYFDLHLSLSPDGKSFAIGTLKRQTALWTLEGFPK